MANNRKLSQFASAAETPEFDNLTITGVSTFQDNIKIDDGSNSTNQKLALNNNIQSDNIVTILQNGGSNFGDDATVISIDAVLNYQGTTSFTGNRTHTGFNLDFLHNNSSGHSSANGQRLTTRGVIIDLDHNEGAYNTQSLVVQNHISKRNTDGSNTQIGINNDVTFDNSSGDASGSTGSHVIHGIDNDLTFTGVNDRSVTLYGIDTRIFITGAGINTFSSIFGSYVALSTPSGGTSNNLGDSYGYYVNYDYDAAGSYDNTYLYYGNYNNQSQNTLTGERRGIWINGATHNQLTGRLTVGTVDADNYDPTSNQLVVYHDDTDSPDAGITIVGGASTAFSKIHFADGTNTYQEDVGRIIYDHNTNELQLWTNNSQTMTIDNDGVGIGITNPTKKLEISASNNSNGENNTLRFVDTDGSSGENQQTGRIEFYTSDTTQSGVQAYILGAAENAAGAGGLRFGTGTAGSAAERLRITSAGNIGIGTDNPSRKLVVQDSGSTFLSVKAGTSDDVGLIFGDTDSDARGLIRYANNGDSLRFWTAGSEKVRITSGGSVGIGSDNPSQKLNVAGNIMLEGSDQFMYLSNVGTGNAGIYVRGNSASSFLRSHSTGIFTWEVTGSEKMRITSGGKLGLNVTSPGCQTGGIHAVHSNTEGTPSFTGGEVGIFQRNFNSAQSSEISIVSGTAGKSTINFGDKDDVNIGMIEYENSNNALVFTTNTSERFRIDEDGYRSFSTQPYALLRKDGTSDSITADAFVQYDETVTSEGGMTVSTNKDRITVPKTGKYAVFGAIAGSNTTVSVGDGWRCEIWLNGSVYSNIYMYPINTVGASVGEEYNLQSHLIIPASANDYFEIRVASIGSARANIRYGYFCVYYLG